MPIDTEDDRAVMGGAASASYIINESMPAFGAGESHIGAVGGHTVQVLAEMTRPADTTAYTANDAVTNSTSATTALEWALARTSGGGITPNRFWLSTNKTGMTARFRLWLYRDTPASPPNDNAAFSQSWANASNRLGYVDFTTAVSGSDVTDWAGMPVFSTSFAVVPVDTKLYGLLQTLDAFTPNAGQIFRLSITAYQD